MGTTLKVTNHLLILIKEPSLDLPHTNFMHYNKPSQERNRHRHREGLGGYTLIICKNKAVFDQ